MTTAIEPVPRVSRHPATIIGYYVVPPHIPALVVCPGCVDQFDPDTGDGPGPGPGPGLGAGPHPDCEQLVPVYLEDFTEAAPGSTARRLERRCMLCDAIVYVPSAQETHDEEAAR